MINARPSRLLIVDEHEMNRDMLARRAPHGKGYVIGLAENAQRLLQRVNKTTWIWCCWTLEMPEISGLTPENSARALFSGRTADHHGHGKKTQSDDIVKRWI